MNYSTVGCEFKVNESKIRYSQTKEEEIHLSVHKVTLEYTEVISALCGKGTKKMNLWIHEMTTNKISVVGSSVARSKIFTVMSLSSRIKKKDTSHFKSHQGTKNIKLTDEAGSFNQEATEEFLKCLLSIQDKDSVEAQVFNTDEPGLLRMLLNEHM